MRGLRNIAEAQEVFERRPHIRRVSEPLAGERHSPLVAKALAIDVKVRYRDLLVVRVTMWRAAQIEADEHHDLPRSVLHLDLEQVNATAAQVEQELFALVGGLKRQRH